jgi:hypothetical protein
MKTIYFTALTIICLTVSSIVSAETVLIAPPEITLPEVGQKLMLDIKVEGAKGLFGFEFDLSYNPEFLKFSSATEGDFLQSAGQTFAVSPIIYGSKPKDGGVGTIRMGVSQLGGKGVNGDGMLAQVEFEVIKEASAPILLEFQKVSLFDAQANKKSPEKMVGSKILPRKKVTPWDVNDDGQVDIGDLVLVGLHFGKTIKEPVSPNPDVNGDGVVDISDVVLIGKHFGESTKTPPAAPVASTSTP